MATTTQGPSPAPARSDPRPWPAASCPAGPRLRARSARCVAAVGLVAVLPVNGRAQTILLALLLFGASQTVWSFAVEGRRHAVDRLATTLVYATGVIALVPLVAILATVVAKGMKVFSVSFLLHSMRNVSPLRPGGGAYHAIIGTLEVVGIAALIGIPIGMLVAIYLVEYGTGKRLARWVTFFVDVMTGIPSIVAGLFIYTGLILTLGWERTGFTGALSLTILMIPVMVRSTEEMLKLVPNELRESAYALGVPKYRTDPAGRHPDRVAGHHHRRHAGGGPDHRRDRPAAAHHVHLGVDQLQPVHGPAGDPAHLHLGPDRARHPRLAGPGLGRPRSP